MQVSTILHVPCFKEWIIFLYVQEDFNIKVEGAKTNIPPKTNTYKRFPFANTLVPWTVSLI